jgi:predicted DNA-binding transcriptional regulator YafY
MRAPTARLLELLELLQTRPLTTGREIAAALDVDPRTVRRYIEALQELGIPVEGQRGVGGGYRVRPGYRLPPLMLSEDEAVVVVLGLVAARREGLDGERGSVDGALAKVHRVLPDTLRRKAEALEATLAFTRAARQGAPVAGESVLLIADAIRRRRRIRTEYRTHAGEHSRRELSPHGLVFHAGRWYLAAFDHLRDALRTFRVDRMSSIALLREAAVAAPAGFDAAEHVSSSLAQVPWGHEVEVVLDLPLDEARRRLPRTLATLAETDEGTLLRMQVGSLEWMASVLAGLGCGFEIRSPDELRQHVRELARRLADLARRPRPSQARRRVSRP